MSVNPPAESGPALDQQLSRLIDGPRNCSAPPPCSSDDTAADALLERLSRHGIAGTLDQDADYWYCVFWAPRPGDGAKERVASGSATTRALAISRAVLNLPLSGTGKRLRLKTATRGWIAEETPPQPVFTIVPPAREEESGGTTSQALDDPSQSLEEPRAARKS